MHTALQPHQAIRSIAPDLFCVDGEWFDSPFKRRMTIVRLKDGSLVIHSAIRMQENDLKKLDELGPVRLIVVPNVFHGDEAPFYAERYPEARVFVPEKLVPRASKRMRVSGALERDWPLRAELPCISFEKTMAHESVFVHPASRTLILTDMAFNLSAVDFKRPVEKLIFGKWNGILDAFGPSRLTRLLVARDRSAVRRALKQIAEHDFDRVIMSHGRLVESGGREKFLEGYRRVYRLDL